jgi:hypothetical protein
MNEEAKGPEQSKTRWFVALDWFPQNNRSISPLIQSRLCPGCARQIREKGEAESLNAMLAKIRGCCSHAPDFINDRLPILESAFRLFLANGNKPLGLEELGRQLGELRGGDPYRTAPETLLRLLKNDRYYGLQEVKS